MSAGGPAAGRLWAALRQRARGPYEAIDRIERRLEALADELQELRADVGNLSDAADAIAERSQRLNDDLRLALRALAADERGTDG